MTRYVPDHETGSPLCDDCAATADHNLPCDAEWCQCWCRVEAGLAELRDDRPGDKLHVVANELDRERVGDLRDLTAERFGSGRRP